MPVHVPPFLHGLGWHLFCSIKTNKYKFNDLEITRPVSDCKSAISTIELELREVCLWAERKSRKYTGEKIKWERQKRTQTHINATYQGMITVDEYSDQNIDHPIISSIHFLPTPSFYPRVWFYNNHCHKDLWISNTFTVLSSVALWACAFVALSYVITSTSISARIWLTLTSDYRTWRNDRNEGMTGIKDMHHLKSRQWLGTKTETWTTGDIYI